MTVFLLVLLSNNSSFCLQPGGITCISSLAFVTTEDLIYVCYILKTCKFHVKKKSMQQSQSEHGSES